MSELNILNKRGYLTDEDRKQPLSHSCNYVTFKSCIDLSEGIQVESFTGNDITIEQYSQDLSTFMIWWTNFVFKDLNGFYFANIKFDLNFKLI